MIEQVVVGRLLATAPVAAIVGDRVTPVVLRQATRSPVMVYQRLYSQRLYSLGGSAHMAETQIQFTCWAADYATARALADEVRKALDVWGSAADGVEVATVSDGADTYAEEYDMLGATVLATFQHREV